MCISTHHLSDDVGDGDEQQGLINVLFLSIAGSSSSSVCLALNAARPKERCVIGAVLATRNLHLCPQGSSQEAEGWVLQ